MSERQRYTIFDSLARREFFFSTKHLQRLYSRVSVPDEFVAVSFTLPMSVIPRPSLPDGLVDTIEKYVMIFHPGQKEIPNPDPLFVPDFRAVATYSEGA